MIPAKKLLSALIIVMGISISVAYTQPNDDPPDNPPVPISGIEYLLVLGGAIGAKKIYELRRQKV